MKLPKEKQHVIDFIFPVSLFFVFAACALAVVLLAASVYQDTAALSERNYEARTSLDYITEKIRQGDTSGAVSAGTFGGEPCLTVRESYGDISYLTMIYRNEGMLKELFIQEGVKAKPSDGTDILPVEDFSVRQTGKNLLEISCTTTDGLTVSQSVALRSDSGAAREGGMQYDQ